MRIGVVVEGHGDEAAVPLLLRRIAAQMGRHDVEVLRPHRVSRSKVVKPGELERVVEFVAMRAGPRGPILVLLDADDDCPATLAPQLLARARQQRPDREIAVVFATREFESWFVAGARSLDGHRTFCAPEDLPSDTEGLSGAKEWLRSRMARGYSETLDQPAFAAVLDLDAASTAPSFAKLVRDVARLLQTRGQSSP